MSQPQDANELLMSGGIRSIGWDKNPVGYTAMGTILDPPKAVQMTKFDSTELDFWPSGDPKMEIIVTLATDMRDPANPLDDGKRRLHITPRMMGCVREAVQRASAPGLEVGARIAVQRTGGTGKQGSPFEFAADYARPALDPGTLLGPNGATQPTVSAAPPAVNAQPAPAVVAPQQPAQPVGTGLLGQAGNGVVTPTSIAPPPGVDPAVWAALPEAQRQAVLAAMANPAATEAPF